MSRAGGSTGHGPACIKPNAKTGPHIKLLGRVGQPKGHGQLANEREPNGGGREHGRSTCNAAWVARKGVHSQGGWFNLVNLANGA